VIPIVKCLLRKYARVDIPDSVNRTPYDWTTDENVKKLFDEYLIPAEAQTEDYPPPPSSFDDDENEDDGYSCYFECDGEKAEHVQDVSGPAPTQEEPPDVPVDVPAAPTQEEPPDVSVSSPPDDVPAAPTRDIAAPPEVQPVPAQPPSVQPPNETTESVCDVVSSSSDSDDEAAEKREGEPVIVKFNPSPGKTGGWMWWW
jgi:hypothetical protein